MAISNSQIIHFLLATVSSTFFFLLLITKANSQETVTFSFPKFTQNQTNIILQRDAVVTSEGKLQLTTVENEKPTYRSVGRALYSAPIRLYDSSTNKVASFVTSFEFVIYAPNKTTTAEGLAFFLAHPDTTAPNTLGGYLGLFSNENYNKSNQVVAVEFDTFINSWDPSNRHIGLDVNSIKSRKTASWGFANGQTANVVISYDGLTGVLVAYLVHASRQTGYILTSKVDLQSALPEWVRIGFSAATGEADPAYVETHDVTSWSFASTFEGTAADALKEINPHLASRLGRDFV